MTTTHKVLVVGATGGSGREAVRQLLAEGYAVTAFSRHADQLDIEHANLRTVNGDAMRIEDIDSATAGQDAVVVTLGISESPLRVRLRGSATTPINVRSAGTANVIAAMRSHGIRRLAVQTSYGVGETRTKLPLTERLVFKLLLKPQIDDTERQEQLVRSSGLDWVIVQPVTLTDGVDDEAAFTSVEGETRRMKVSRRSVARFLVDAVKAPDYVGRAVALSAA